LLAAREGEHFASVDSGLSGHKTRHNLAVLYLDNQRWAEAEAQWQAALNQSQDFLPAWLGLGELYLKQHRWKDLDRVVRNLKGNESTPTLESSVLLARSYLERSEFAAARWTLTEAIDHHPDALMPRVILSHVYLREGGDWKGAERALLDVLAKDPNHREAARNLEILRARHLVPV